MPLYGQCVIGPPGVGKSTYCNGMQQYLTLLGRDVAVVNLDPANESISQAVAAESEQQGTSSSSDEKNGDEAILPYKATLDVCTEVVNLVSVMEQLNLGPNGGLVYCMEYLEANANEWIPMLKERIDHDDTYLIFDLPGQVELYTHGTCVANLMQQLVKELDLRLCAVQLVDATYCLDPTKFLSAALLSTTTMLRLELPSVSVLSKMDLLQQHASEGGMPFQLEYFLECQELDRLVDFLDMGNSSNYDQEAIPGSQNEFYYADDPDYQAVRRKRRESRFYRKHNKLHSALAEVVNDFGLLSFLPLDISKADSVGRVVGQVDKCNGYLLRQHSTTDIKKQQEDLFQCAIQAEDPSARYEQIADIQERLTYSLDANSKRGKVEKRTGPRG